MGIPGLNSWFVQKFATSYVKLTNVKIDHVYIDMNSVLHLALRRASNMHHFYCLVFQKCDEILTYCQPKKSVLFALDGPAPVAKLLTQRLRRKRMTLTPSEEKGKMISPLAITPGTPFMEQVHEALAYYICQRLIQQKWRHLRMELSGSTVQGEGECKILSRLQTPLGYMNPQDTHVLIGNDSDLLMMGLMAKCTKLFVFGQIMNKMKMASSNNDTLRAFSLTAFESSLTNVASSNGFSASKSLMDLFLRGLRYDLVITCILSRGNDYIPSVSGISLDSMMTLGFPGIRKGDQGLWKRYLELRSTNEYKTKSISVFEEEGAVQLDYEFLFQLLKASNLQSRSERRILEYQKAPDPHLYIDGLQWILTMYSKGVCPDYRFVYDGLGPTHDQLCQALLQRNQDKMQDSEKKKESNLPLKPSECALAMLPYHGRQYIPESIQHLMEPDSPIGDLYQECEECNRLSELNSKATQKLNELRKREETFQTRLEGLKEDDKDMEQVNKHLELIEVSIEETRAKLRELSIEREKHFIEKHPYQPFPIERIEDAVRNISRMQRSDRATTSSSRSTPLTKFNRIASNAPEPPSEKMKKFKMPLPILRGKYMGDRMSPTAISANARRFFRMMRRL